MLRTLASLDVPTIPTIPTIPIPQRWPFPVVATLAMLALAVLDIVGALLARAWLADRSLLVFIAGITVFGLLFWVYGSSLRYAELATVPFGWVVLLQIGLLLIERVQTGVRLSAGRWTALVLILALRRT